MDLDEVQHRVVSWIVRGELKGLPYSVEQLAGFTGCSVDDLRVVLDQLAAMGALLFDYGPDAFRSSYLGRVLIGGEEAVQYTYQAESTARQKIMWEQALDRADAAGEAVEWTGYQPGGIDHSIPVPEVTAAVEEAHRLADASASNEEH
jgi:hypothetical protein